MKIPRWICITVAFLLTLLFYGTLHRMSPEAVRVLCAGLMVFAISRLLIAIFARK